ncbi:MAG: hypothetical protein ISS15_20275 [Alphaproteobacteria bacterium]|nr:hypothetical protein [Alphaproteobacteria bacterium]MBL7100000.1 hypothetical protein [Alphaproteobacteria bacterium]
MDDPASRAQQRVLLLAVVLAAALMGILFAASQLYPGIVSPDSRVWISFTAISGAAILFAVVRLRNPRR